jgi:general secretion pathway protein G
MTKFCDRQNGNNNSGGVMREPDSGRRFTDRRGLRGTKPARSGSRSLFSHLLGNESGLTLAEMIVAAIIIAILASATMPVARVSEKRAKEIELQESLRVIRNAIDKYKDMADAQKIETKLDEQGYPPTLEILVKGVPLKDDQQNNKQKFLRRIPRNPFTNEREWGLRSVQDDPDSQVWGGENVFDVYSLYNSTALDGTEYKDW